MYNYLYKIINHDKFLHFVYGIAICAIMQPFGTMFALIVVLTVGLTKEYLDKKGYGTFDVRDAWFTFFGGVYLITWHWIIGYVQNMVL